MIVNLFKAFGLVFVVAMVAALLLPAVQRARPAARRTQCKNNLKQIMLGLIEYESEHGVLPPAYTVNSEGEPLHSWRTLILPYIDQDALYRKIDLSKPWNDPGNEQAYKTPVTTYSCPAFVYSDPKSKPSGIMTTYLAAVTADSCLRPTESRSLKEIPDGASNTLVVFEVANEQAIHWMQPTDAYQEMIVKFGSFKTRAHEGGAQVAMANGMVRFISANISEATLRALISTDGGEIIGDF